MTRYCVRFTWNITGTVIEKEFDSMLDKILFLTGFGAHLTVLKEWQT